MVISVVRSQSLIQIDFSFYNHHKFESTSDIQSHFLLIFCCLHQPIHIEWINNKQNLFLKFPSLLYSNGIMVSPFAFIAPYKLLSLQTNSLFDDAFISLIAFEINCQNDLLKNRHYLFYDSNSICVILSFFK